MDKAYFLLLAALLVVHFATTNTSSLRVATTNNTRDLDALLALKATILDPQNILPINWSTSASVCSWIGITCNSRHHRVAAIDLSNMGLVGTIPPQLGNLSFLVRLNLGNNSFHGSPPTELSHLRRLRNISLRGNDFGGNLPSWFGALPELEFLSLRENRFTGSLSGVFSNATKLHTLVLDHNSITGDIPEHICSDHLPQLQKLYLRYNQLQGEIPSGIRECSRLQILSLYDNKLHGYIPREIWNLTTLQEISLSKNDLEGQIPEDIYNLQNLRILWISENDMTGVIPDAIGYLNKLELIGLDSNRLTGPTPVKLFNISSLRFLSISGNELSGSLPPTLGLMLPNLEGFYIGHNRLSGVIPTSISNASRLAFLDFSSNQFIGAIPHSLGDLRFLELLSLANNSFSYKYHSGESSFLTSLSNCRHLKKLWIAYIPLNGYLPISIGNLSSTLESLYLNNCGIRGQIPSSIGNISNLVELNMAVNALEGTTPATIRGLLKLQRVDLGYNKIQGSFPSELCHLFNLGLISLSSNKLSGRLPHCIGNITSLRYLYLDSNNLTSNLPLSLWSLKDILELNLSINSFRGSIPSEIGNSNALIIMDLSLNDFYGDIPTTIGALQELHTLSLKHNKLQGLIPESMTNMLALQYLDLSFNSLVGVIPKSLEALSDLVYFNVSYNRLIGPIPHGGPFGNFTDLSFLSNEALCDALWLLPCQTFEHKSRKKTVFFVLLALGLAILAMLASFLVMRKWRRKFVAPTNLFPETTFERVSFHELRQITNGFNENTLLGSGSFGSVYKGIRENGMIWAIKVFNLPLEGGFQSFDSECEVLRCLRHRNLTKVISACSNPDFKALILEYMPNGCLEKWLYSDHHFLNIRQRLDIMIDVVCGLEYLHYGYSIPVVHCDLKPSNILLDRDMVGHICDFGIAKLLGDGESVVQTKTLATFGYIAPEYGLDGLVSRRCDVYSFGITLMETFTKRRPKDEMFTEELSLSRWIQESLPDSIIQVIDVDLLHVEDELVKKKIECVSSILQLALSCTTNAPDERINMKDILRALQKIKFQFFEELRS